LSSGKTRITNALFSDDTQIFADALQTLGFDVQLLPDQIEMRLTGLGGNIPTKQARLFCGNAGTAARFLSAFLTIGHGEYVLDGDTRMRERPIGDLVTALTQLGAIVEMSPSNGLPVKIMASGLPGGLTRMTGDISSQFLSALLMISPYAQKPVEIKLTTGLNSKPYVNLTLAMMCDFGVEIERKGYEYFAIHQTTNRREPIPLNLTPPQPPIFLPLRPFAAGRYASSISPAVPNKATLPFLIFFRKWAAPSQKVRTTSR
jgi:3-phosphoshikimate 1-carboxyvinyltransferase